MKASEWAFDRIKEAFEQVAQDEAEKVSIVQEIMLRSTDYPVIVLSKHIQYNRAFVQTWWRISKKMEMSSYRTL